MRIYYVKPTPQIYVHAIGQFGLTDGMFGVGWSFNKDPYLLGVFTGAGEVFKILSDETVVYLKAGGEFFPETTIGELRKRTVIEPYKPAI